MAPELIALLVFACAFLLLLLGYPVAFTLGGLAVGVGLWYFGVDFFYLLSLRIYGIMSQYVLLAVPLFVYMGMMLEKTEIAKTLLLTLSHLARQLRGSLLLAVVGVGALLAASTGIVGATVLTLGLLGLPVLIEKQCRPSLAMGTIAASGTLGQIVPPSIILCLLGSVLQVSIGHLFKAALLPALLLLGLYMGYVLLHGWIRPQDMPRQPKSAEKSIPLREVIEAFVFPMLLIVAVLGSIFAGIASPTESAALGAAGTTLLALYLRKLNVSVLREVMRRTLYLSSMVFMILIGATAFSLIFRALGGEQLLLAWVEQESTSPTTFLAALMVVVFVAGFFIDFIEIIFIIVPIAWPLLQRMEMDLYWVGILLALNLQTSFLTPPFGFALFYLKGICPPELSTQSLYRGVFPFIVLQIVVLLLVFFFPDLFLGWIK